MSYVAKNVQPRTRRLLVIGGVLLAILLLLFLSHQRHQQRIQDLYRDVADAGGHMSRGPPAFSRLWEKLRGQLYSRFMFVKFAGPAFDRAWIERHNNLRDIHIDFLEVVDCPLDGSDLSRLAADHQLFGFRGAGIREADQLVRLLGGAPKQLQVELPDSDLSDQGLLALPLDQLIVLDVSGTQVSANAIEQLKNCPYLHELTMDGRQFNGETKDMILNLKWPYFKLVLRGPSVTDQHIELVREMNVGGKFLDVVLVQTSASPEAIKQLQSELLPPSKVTVGD